MFESFIISFLKSYLGDYVNNLENISLGVMSGNLDLKDLEIKPNKLNEMKLPFKLIHGRIGSLQLSIPWKSNFSSPTILNMEEIHLVVSLIPQENWEFIDFISGATKIEKIKKFAEFKFAELTEALTKEEKNLGYMQRTILKIVDNIHVNIKNVHMRIEEPTKTPFFSLGFTLEELVIINTDENWQEIFIDRNKYKDLNVYKILRIENFGFYLKTNENVLFSNIKDKDILKKSISDSFPKSAKCGKDFEYLIKPISLTSKLKQNNQNLLLPDCPQKNDNENNENNTSVTTNITNNTDLIEGFSKIKILIHLDKFDINFQKSQFDNIIRILNHVSNYQKYQLFNYESRKCYYFRPKISIKEIQKSNKNSMEKKNLIKSWWRYSFTCIKKRLKFLQGNEKEYDRSEIIIKNHEENYELFFGKFLKDPKNLTKNENNFFMEIIANTELNTLYQWSLKGIKDNFTLQKKEENKKNNSSLMGKIFGRKINEENLLSNEEVQKIEEIFESSNRQIKNELILTSKEIKLKIDFMLSEGSFVFSRNKDNGTKESFSFKYKNLWFNLKKGENFSEIDAQLKDFVIDMITVYNKNKIKTTNITYYDKDFVKVDYRTNGNKTAINQDLVNRAWDKWSEIKEKTKENVKKVFEKKNVLEISVAPRNIVIPLNKYDSKRSKILVMELGEIKVKNVDPIQYYDDIYKLEFVNTNIKHFSSFGQMFSNKKNCFELVNDLSLNFTLGLLNSDAPKKILETKPAILLDLSIENVNIKFTESIYYTMHFIIDVLMPTDNTDHWGIVEQSKKEIKNNCNVLGKLVKKNKYNFHQECFGVLSGGYIYFYKHLDDDQFESYFYLKDALVTEKISKIDIINNENDNNNTNLNTKDEFSIELKSKYGNTEMILPNENKFKQWLKGIKERINEMKPFEETKILDTNIDIENNNNKEISNKNKANKKPENNNNNQIDKLKQSSFGLNLIINNVNIELKNEEENLNLNKNSIASNLNLKNLYENYATIFKITLKEFSLNLSLRELDKEINIQLESMQIFDEEFKDNDSFYEIITSIDNKENCKFTKILQMNLIIADDGSPIKHKNTSMDFEINIGCIFAVWRPQAIKRLLLFLAHNEILRSKIKEEILSPKIEDNNQNANHNNKNDNDNYSKNYNNNNKNDASNIFLQESQNSEICILPKCSDSKDTYLSLQLKLQEVKLIWVQPKLNHYFIEVNLNSSYINFEMTDDHLQISGELGNLKLVDLTNYPYTITNQKEYLRLKSQSKKFTEILFFENSSSMKFDYSSYSLICPLCKDNYTSKANIQFNSVCLNFIQEHFFRIFNYLFSDFLGALSAPEKIKEFKSNLSKLPKLKNDQIEFMDLNVTFNNPKLLLKPRYSFEESFLVDLGVVNIKNSYKKVKGKSKNFPEKEKYFAVYSFLLNDLNVCTNDGFKLLEKTNCDIDMDFIVLTADEKISNDPDYLDKCLDFSIKFGDLNMNLRQIDFMNLMKCSDLNFVYIDGLSEFYINEDEEFVAKNRKGSVNANFVDENGKVVDNKDKDKGNFEVFDSNKNEENVYKSNKYNYMKLDLEIPNINLSLFENYAAVKEKDKYNININTEKDKDLDTDDNNNNNENLKIFSSLNLYNMKLNFSQKLTNRKDIYLSASKFEVFQHLINNSKELMLSQYENVNIDSNNNNNNNKPNKNFNLLEITVVMESDRDKNIVIKIDNLKTILRLDTLQLMRYFFQEGFPVYNENDRDLPNQFDPDTDKLPGMRVLIEIRKPIISLLSDTISNHKQDLISLSTDLVLLYDRKKIQSVKKELKNNYENFKKNLSEKEKNLSSKEKIKIENEKYDDSIDTVSINIWLYDICPFICKLEEFYQKNLSIPKRKIMNLFDFNYENKTKMQYSDPNNFVVTYFTMIVLPNMVMKISYRDIVLLLKIVECNNDLLNKEYEEKIESFCGKISKNDNANTNLYTNKHKRLESLAQNPQNINRYSNNKFLPPSNNSNVNNNLIDISMINKDKNNLNKILIKDKIIDKGMSTFKITIEQIQIVVIDDHANTLYPFLSIIIQKFNFSQDCQTLRDSSILVTFLSKLITYNYFAGVWEPLVEKSSITFDYQKTIENNITYKKMNFNISDYKNSVMNINISDLTICFLYETLNSWTDKYFKLKNNYHEEIKKLINDKNKILSNHRIINYTGRNVILYRVQKNQMTKIELKRLKPNEDYDLEYLSEETEIEEIFDKVKGNKALKKNTNTNLIKENLISFEFEDLNPSDVIDKIIKIDKIQTKLHQINFDEIIKKYKTSREIKSDLEKIISEVEYSNMKKLVKLYSPLAFSNKTHKNISLILTRKNLPDYKIVLNPMENFGVPFEYFDGEIIFTNFSNENLNNNNNTNNTNNNQMKFLLKNFFDSTFNKYEFFVEKICLNLTNQKSENNLLHIIAISSAFTVRNCLPMDLELEIFDEKNSNSSLIKIPKSTEFCLDNFSGKSNIFANISILEFSSKFNSNKNTQKLFNAKDYYENLEKYFGKTTCFSNFTYRNYFTISDKFGNPLKLFIQIEDNYQTKNIIIYANAVIINQTMLDLKLYNSNSSSKAIEIPGQKQNLNSNSNNFSSLNNNNNNTININSNILPEEKNIFLIGDEKLLSIEVLGEDKKTQNCFSEPIRLNAIGITSTIECRKGKDLLYEFINDKNLSLVAKDLEIYTNIIRILPKFVIVNDLNFPLMISLNQENHKNNSPPEIIKSKEKRPFYFFGAGCSTKISLRPIEYKEKLQTKSIWNWSYSLSLENSNFQTLHIPGHKFFENKFINFEKKFIDGVTYAIFSETNYKTCQFLLVNNCRNKAFKVFQNSYEHSAEFLDCEFKNENENENGNTFENQKIFSWTNYNDKPLICIEVFNEGKLDILKGENVNNSNSNNNIFEREKFIEDYFIEKMIYEITDAGLVLKDKKRKGKFGNFNKQSYSNNNINNFPNNNNNNNDNNNNNLNQNSGQLTFPYKDFIHISNTEKIIISITTDGIRKIIKFSDEQKEENNNKLTTSVVPHNYLEQNSNSNKNNTNSNSNSTEINEFIFKTNRLGFSFISDNRFIKDNKHKYNRFEILYIIFKEIEFISFTETNPKNNPPVKNTIQLKILNAEFDNQYSHFTKYPIILRRNLENILLDEKENPIILPFFNLIADSKKNKDEINPQNSTGISDVTYITAFKFLIQSFNFSVDSETMEAILNFIENITTQLNTSFTIINPIFENAEKNKEDKLIISKDFYDVKNYYNSIKIKENESKYFIENLNTSSIEMKLSFNTNSKSKFFQKYVTTNPFLSSLLSTVSNIDKADININCFESSNVFGSINDIGHLILSQYNQAVLSKIFTIFGAADFLGNPNNLVKNLGTGFKDFFQKPIEGVMKGPLDGIKGAVSGSVSLIKHAVDGTFSATEKIAGGLSKGLLYITHDEKYMNDLEKKKITEKPTNFIEGFGYGISSMASGVYCGVKDVFVKPVEGAKKEQSFSGFGKGILKGFGGLVTKPISGVLELVSKTSEGIKNTVSNEDSEMKPERKPRSFYGVYKYIKTYNHFDADVIDIMTNKIEQLKNVKISYQGAELYKNHKNDAILLVFSGLLMYLIDISRKEIKAMLNYSDIRDVILELKNKKEGSYDKIKILFKFALNGVNLFYFIYFLIQRESATIYFSNENKNSDVIYRKMKKIIEDYNDK